MDPSEDLHWRESGVFLQFPFLPSVTRKKTETEHMYLSWQSCLQESTWNISFVNSSRNDIAVHILNLAM